MTETTDHPENDIDDDETLARQEIAETERLSLSGADLKLYRALTAFKSDVQDRVRGLVRAKKAAEQLCRTGALDNLELVEKYTDWLRDADLSVIDMDERRAKAVDSLEKFTRERRKRRRMKFMQGLHGLADSADLAIEKLSESPLTLYLEPFVVEPNFDTDEVDLTYGHVSVASTALDPEDVFGARSRAADELDERSRSSDSFFDQLHRAYELALAAEGRQPGDRVELVHLLAPLALLASETEMWRNPDLGEIEPYPKYLLSYQLSRLRSDGLLSKDGVRIDLGTATGGSTRDKDGVVFIPANRADGQYYLSIRFVEDGR